jgi:hypothetical protein
LPALYDVRDDALPPEELAAVRDAVERSDALGDNPLAGTFTSTRGFGLLFSAREREALCARHPWARAFVALALDDAARDYACYLNVLCVPPGGAVGRHVDGTLQEPLGVADALPASVTVLYLRAPAGAGALQLTPTAGAPIVVQPRPGRLVRFAGHLPHEVLPCAPDAARPRLSLVLERYQPPPSALARFVPRLTAIAPVVDVRPVFAGARRRPFASLVRPR